MRSILTTAAVALLAIASAGDASLIQDTTGIPMGDDAGSGGDADDKCAPGDPPRVALTLGEEAMGGLLPVDDNADFFKLPVPWWWGGKTLEVRMDPRLRLPPGMAPLPAIPEAPLPFAAWNFDLAVLDAGCNLLGDSRLEGNQEEVVRVPIPPGATYVVVQVNIPLLFGLVPVPVAGPSAPNLDAQGAASTPMLRTSAISSTAAVGSGTSLNGSPPPCYPMCYLLDSTTS